MEVATRGNRCRQKRTNCVHSLESSLDVATSCDFLDQDRRQSFRAELLVDAEEVDLGALEHLVTNSQLDGNTRDECYELARSGCADTHVPFLLPPWSLESPSNISIYFKLAQIETYQFKKDGEYLKRKVASLSST